MINRTIILTEPRFVGREHHPAGKVLDLPEGQCQRLVADKVARFFTATDTRGSGTIEHAETASRTRPSERAAKFTGRTSG